MFINGPPRTYILHVMTHRLRAVKFQMVGQSKARENGFFFFLRYYYLFSYALHASVCCSDRGRVVMILFAHGIKLVSPLGSPRQLIKATADVYTPDPRGLTTAVNGSLLCHPRDNRRYFCPCRIVYKRTIIMPYYSDRPTKFTKR